MNINDFDEYDTVALAQLIAGKRRWLDTIPSGDVRRNRLITEINLLERIYLNLSAHTNWVLGEMNAEFTKAFQRTMQHPLAKDGRLNGFLFYWHINNNYTRLGHERKPLIATHSNVPVSFCDMIISWPQGVSCTPVDILDTLTDGGQPA